MSLGFRTPSSGPAIPPEPNGNQPAICFHFLSSHRIQSPSIIIPSTAICHRVATVPAVCLFLSSRQSQGRNIICRISIKQHQKWPSARTWSLQRRSVCSAPVLSPATSTLRLRCQKLTRQQHYSSSRPQCRRLANREAHRFSPSKEPLPGRSQRCARPRRIRRSTATVRPVARLCSVGRTRRSTGWFSAVLWLSPIRMAAVDYRGSQAGLEGPVHFGDRSWRRVVRPVQPRQGRPSNHLAVCINGGIN